MDLVPDNPLVRTIKSSSSANAVVSCNFINIYRLFWLFLLITAGCSQAPSLLKLPPDQFPGFQDDLDRASLIKAANQSLNYLTVHSKNHRLTEGALHEPERLEKTITAFLQILRTTPSLSSPKLSALVSRRFSVYQAAGQKNSQDHNMLVTGYFQPIFQGSLTREPPFIYPIYTTPPDLIIRTRKNGEKQFGRLVSGRFVPYWSRKDIETRHKAAGSELLWLSSPLDAFFLHIQGSGLIQLQDGTCRGVHYAAKNGQPYRSIGKILVKNGKIQKEKISMKAIREYLEHHEHERDTILFANPSYIFFEWNDQTGALGNLEQELTPKRSIAADQELFPAGSLAFLKTREPVVKAGAIIAWKPVHRFVFLQDKGSAINGPGVIDLYMGTGKNAGVAAGSMQENGKLYFLFLKPDT